MKTWVDREELVKFHKSLLSKERRTTFEDLLVRLTELKDELQEINYDLTNHGFSRPKYSKLTKVCQLKNRMLRKVLFYIDTREEDHRYYFYYNKNLNKITFVILKDSQAIHISHIQPRDLIYMSKEPKKVYSMIEEINNDQVRNELKKKYQEEKHIIPTMI